MSTNKWNWKFSISWGNKEQPKTNAVAVVESPKPAPKVVNPNAPSGGGILLAIVIIIIGIGWWKRSAIIRSLRS
jgi:hypothetical protein